MNFPTFIKNLMEAALVRTGEAVKKERAKSGATDLKAKDAARKRAERAKQIPRERKPKQELVKEVIAVKTASGRVQLIFKDSFNKNEHQKLNKDVLTMEEARQFSGDPKFEQTRASKLLFGNLKEKKKETKETKTKKEDKDTKETEKKDETPKEKEEQKPERKAKRLSKQEIFKVMSQMDGNQLAGMPLEMRQEYFKAIRNPPSNTDFDNMSYEALTVKFGLNPVSSLPYNQQVLNALMFLAKIKAGASDQELQTYNALAPTAMEFTRPAFLTARKILSQLGEECIQNIVSSMEAGAKPVNAEGSVDMQCGDYRFKVSAGGEMSLSTTQFDQSNKSFRGLIGSALMQTLSNPSMMQADPKYAQIIQTGQENASKFSTTLIPEEMLSAILADESLLKELQKMKLKNGAGEDIGPIIDENGQLNPLASLSKFKEGWIEATKPLLSGAKSTEKSVLKSSVVNNILKYYLRGDNRIPPEAAPNHLITVNGVFPMTDDYFDAISKQADIDIKPAKDVINSSNIGSFKTSSAETLKKYRTIVEQNENKKPKLKDILIPQNSINPFEFIIKNLVDNNDFLLNASLLPGFSPKDLNAVQYNYVKIGKKTIKIPVLGDEGASAQVMQEAFLVLNDALIEALTNNFVLDSLVTFGLITDSEKLLFEEDASILLEGVEGETPIKQLYHSALQKIYEHPDKFVNFLNSVQEEYKRDYKKEYKNYHGKPKQRKERAARTAARELMIKKGRAKKGDGKDIDHKRPLRNGGSKSINNLRVREKSSNRSDNGHSKGEKQNKGSWK